MPSTKKSSPIVVDMEEEKKSDVVIKCTCRSMVRAVRLLMSHLGITGEPFTIPGAPATITIVPRGWPAMFKRAKDGIIEVVKRHSPNRVVLVTHTGCTYYDTTGAFRGLTPANIKNVQHGHLRSARESVQSWVPGCTVQIYFAGPTTDGKMKFQEL